jgi:hypothetical protein
MKATIIEGTGKNSLTIDLLLHQVGWYRCYWLISGILYKSNAKSPTALTKAQIPGQLSSHTGLQAHIS